MKPTQTLPVNYVLAWDLNLKHNTRLNIILQIVGVAWMALAGWLLTSYVMWLRPDFAEAFKKGFQIELSGMLLLLAVLVIALLIHELVHGLFFWLFAGQRPEFGIGPGYAFAAMPDWFYPKYKYLAVGLSPLLVITCLGLLASAFVPLAWLGLLLSAIIFNAGGAIGDIYVCWRIARESKQVWVKDTGDGFQVYRQQVG
jgi:hypothetical protein